jgi:hypothetical protein
MHGTVIAVMMLLLAAAYVGYLARRQSWASASALLLACSIVMVMTPNLLWLHHVILLTPAYVVLTSDAAPLWERAAAGLSLFAFQLLRVFALGSGAEAVCAGAAEVILLTAGTCAVVRAVWLDR